MAEDLLKDVENEENLNDDKKNLSPLELAEN